MRTTHHAAVGLNGAALDSIDADVRAGKYGYVDRILVIRRGRLAFDRRYRHDYERIYGDSARAQTAPSTHDLTGPYNYFSAWWHPYYRKGDLHTLQSVTKTITSIVIGTAVTRGEFPSLDTPLLSFFDSGSVANVDDRKRRMTVRHLLTMTAGISWDEAKPYGDTTNTAIGLEGSYDWVRFTIDRPMMEEPGARFNYNSGASQLLAHVFRRATGTDIEEYAARHLFAPLGIRDWHWKRTPAGPVDTEGGLYLAAEDQAKLACLFLRGGTWDGKRAERGVGARLGGAGGGHRPRAGRAALRPQVVALPQPGRHRPRRLGRLGFGGQFPLVVPEDDLIVVINQWNILSGRPSLPMRPTLARILGAVTDRRR